MKNILIVTPNPMAPPHPRVEMICEILKEENFNVKVLHPPQNTSLLKRTLFLMREMRRLSPENDTFIVYDLLTLLYVPFLKKKKIVYDVLDNFPSYYPYQFFKNKRPVVKKVMSWLLSKIEFWLTKNHVSMTLVNSKALYKRFTANSTRHHAKLLYYSSPFETIKIKNNPSLPPCLIYLGLFDKEKGAEKILDLFYSLSQDVPKLKLYIFGDIVYPVPKHENVITQSRLSKSSLTLELSTILKKNFLLGVSLIESVHYSYQTQEANKDIDYLACGIPIIGNKRVPTYEKIQSECGVLHTNRQQIVELLTNEDSRFSYIQNCLQVYQKNYSKSTFESIIKSLK